MGLPAACGRVLPDGYGRRDRCVDLTGSSDPELGDGSDDGSDHEGGSTTHIRCDRASNTDTRSGRGSPMMLIGVDTLLCVMPHELSA